MRPDCPLVLEARTVGPPVALGPLRIYLGQTR
jgi:hypothetical protein